MIFILTVVVRDKHGNILTEEALNKKVIDIPEYYTFMQLVKTRIKKEYFDNGRKD